MPAKSLRTGSSGSRTTRRTASSPSPYRWTLPPEAEVQEDPLRLRLDFHGESVVLHDYAGGVTRTKFVSALDVAHALASELDLASGVLPRDTLCWARTAAGERLALWREPRVWTVRLRERFDAPPRHLRLTMPGLVFICLPARQAPYVFAAKGRPKRTEDELYHCPTYNVFSSGRVCTGSHAFPADPAKVPEEFFRSYFSATGDTARGKSRRHPDDVGALWAELDRRDSFPLDDLVPALRVADALRVAS